MLPPRAFVDPAVLEWELGQRSSATAGSAPATSRRVAEPGAYVIREIGAGQRRRDRRRGRHARAPSTTSAAIAARGCSRRRRAGPQAAPLPVPRLVLRPRRQPPRRSPHGRGRGLRPDLLRPAPGAAVAVVGGLVLVDLSGEARPGRGHVGELLAAPRALQRRRARAAAAILTYEVAGQLEGDRRELQRVPPLPRRPPRAQRAQRLHERRERSTAPAPGAAAR